MSCIARSSHDDEQRCTDAGSCTTMIPKTKPTDVTNTERMAGRETNGDRRGVPELHTLVFSNVIVQLAAEHSINT